MKSALIDASSAILLFKTVLFKPMTVLYDLAVVPSVLKELTVPHHQGAGFFDQMVARGNLKLFPLVTGLPVAEGLDALGQGERDTLMAYVRHGADFIIIDDRKGAMWCRSNQVPYVNALLCAKILFLSGEVRRTIYIKRHRRILQIGRYSRWILEYVDRCDETDLQEFMP